MPSSQQPKISPLSCSNAAENKRALLFSSGEKNLENHVSVKFCMLFCIPPEKEEKRNRLNWLKPH